MARIPIRFVAFLAAASLLAAGCGSSTSGGGSTSKSTPLTGTPIKVGQIVPVSSPNLSEPELAEGLKASVQALNRSGGINGHPLDLIQCDSQGDPTIEVQCAQSLVADHVVATLEDMTVTKPDEVQAIFSAAGIPRIGLTEDQPSEYQAKTNFDFTGGGVFLLVGMMNGLASKGDKRISMMIPDSPQSGEFHVLFDPIAHSLGLTIVNYVLVSSASGDYSQYVAQAEEHDAQGVVLALATSQLVQVALVANQLNPKVDFSTGMEGLSLDQLKQLGNFAKKAIYVCSTPAISDTKNFPGLNEVISDLSANEPHFSVDSASATQILPWLAVHSFYEVLKGRTTSPVTPATVTAAYRDAKDIQMNGLIKPWTPSDYQSAGSLTSLFSNVSNPWMYRISFNGSEAQTTPAQMFNTFSGLPGTS
jgi:ABC-type branched-subunit amino acid transport system substrate-binding protein